MTVPKAVVVRLCQRSPSPHRTPHRTLHRCVERPTMADPERPPNRMLRAFISRVRLHRARARLRRLHRTLDRAPSASTSACGCGPRPPQRRAGAWRTPTKCSGPRRDGRSTATTAPLPGNGTRTASSSTRRGRTMGSTAGPSSTRSPSCGACTCRLRRCTRRSACRSSDGCSRATTAASWRTGRPTAGRRTPSAAPGAPSASSRSPSTTSSTTSAQPPTACRCCGCRSWRCTTSSSRTCWRTSSPPSSSRTTTRAA
mmetsp:Transcript_8176/g.13387  ORF Transcript_8176/g.13387 Transcript_8176/m.13387 type:complete len:256 (-) Transcript_8176:978-1745(-)